VETSEVQCDLQSKIKKLMTSNRIVTTITCIAAVSSVAINGCSAACSCLLNSTQVPLDSPKYFHLVDSLVCAPKAWPLVVPPYYLLTMFHIRVPQTLWCVFYKRQGQIHGVSGFTFPVKHGVYISLDLQSVKFKSLIKQPITCHHNVKLTFSQAQ